jgi:methylmalonyl-CoA mutase cobalamin-binding subunit
VATPLTTCLVVLGKYVPSLRFFDTLLGDEPVLSPDSRLYQRMLALDAEDAEDVVEEYREDHTMTQAFDDVLLPALAMAERDRHAGHLTVERIDFIRVAMRELVEEMSRQAEPSPSDSVDLASATDPAAPARPAAVPGMPEVRSRIVVIPSVDAADKTAACMLKALLDRRGFDVIVLDEEELASEKLEQAFSQRADVVVISAVPPRAVSRARYLVKRLQQAQSQRGQKDDGLAAATVVGLWTVQYDRKRAADRVKGQASEIRVVTTMAEAVEEVRQRAQVVSTRRAAAEEAPVGAGKPAPA